MREIAAGLDMAPGALYYYFESKEALLYACQEISLTRLVAEARKTLRSELEPEAQLRALISSHLDLTLDELGGSAAHVEFHALPEVRLAEIVKKRDVYEGLIRGLIRRGIKQGAFRPVDVKLTTMALLGALNWSVVWFKPEGRWSSAHLVEGFADVFVNGLRAETPNRSTDMGAPKRRVREGE